MSNHGESLICIKEPKAKGGRVLEYYKRRSIGEEKEYRPIDSFKPVPEVKELSTGGTKDEYKVLNLED